MAVRRTEEAFDSDHWELVTTRAPAVLAVDPENGDAAAFLNMAVADGVNAMSVPPSTVAPAAASVSSSTTQGEGHMADENRSTTALGIPVDVDQHSLTAGTRGPVLTPTRT